MIRLQVLLVTAAVTELKASRDRRETAVFRDHVDLKEKSAHRDRMEVDLKVLAVTQAPPEVPELPDLRVLPVLLDHRALQVRVVKLTCSSYHFMLYVDE